MQCREDCRVVAAAESPASSRVANDTPQKRNRPSSPEQMKRTTETRSGGLLFHLWCSPEMERKGLAQQDVFFPSQENRESAGPFIGKQKEEDQVRNRKVATLCGGGDRNGQ